MSPSQKGEIRDSRPLRLFFFQIHEALALWGARPDRDLIHQRPITTSKGIRIPAVCSPLGASSGRGRVRRGRGAASTLHRVLPQAGWAAKFPKPWAAFPEGCLCGLRERMVICSIPEALLGGPGPSKDPPFMFSSKVKKITEEVTTEQRTP